MQTCYGIANAEIQWPTIDMWQQNVQGEGLQKTVSRTETELPFIF